MIGGTPEELRVLEYGLSALANYCTGYGLKPPKLLVPMRDELRSILRRLEAAGELPKLEVAEDEPVPLPIAFNVHEAARQVRVSESTIERAVKDGKLKAARIGRAVRFTPDALAEWVRSCEEGK